MEKKVIFAGQRPRIYIKTQGDLNIKGDETKEVVIRTDSLEDCQLDAEDDEVRIICSGDLNLRVPRQSYVEAEEVSGSAALKAIEGEVTIGKVHGNLSIKDTGPAAVESVSGDLAARQVAGDLEVRRASGSVRVNEVQGDFVVSGVINGSLKLEDVAGDIRAHANGSIQLNLDPRAGQRIDLTADGSIICRLAEDASVNIHVERAADVKVILEQAQLQNERAPFQITLGEGEADLILSAGGQVLLAEQAPEWEFGSVEADFKTFGEDIGSQVSAQLEQQMHMMESQFEAQLENLAFSLEGAGISSIEAERISRKAREASARATARAQEKMKRAQEKIQRKVEAAQRRAEAKARAAERRGSSRDRRSFNFSWSSQPSHPTAPSDPVSEDERMMILKMLEENKITPEEADTLLDALEG
jgi:hypothetical protein